MWIATEAASTVRTTSRVWWSGREEQTSEASVKCSIVHKHGLLVEHTSRMSRVPGQVQVHTTTAGSCGSESPATPVPVRSLCFWSSDHFHYTGLFSKAINHIFTLGFDLFLLMGNLGSVTRPVKIWETVIHRVRQKELPHLLGKLIKQTRLKV